MCSKVVEFLNQRSVFVTGSTGFYGKALIEKLLRSCDGIENVYVLIRLKNGKSLTKRLQELCEDNVSNYLLAFFTGVVSFWSASD